MDVATRFWAKVDKTPTCWLWTRAKIRNGYGNFWDGERWVVAHRWAWEQLVGPIPEGLTLDHLIDRCGNRHCVNPDHLEPVTGAENTRRKAIVNRTHCPHNHELTTENTYVNSRGHRRCRACRRIAQQTYEAKKAGM